MKIRLMAMGCILSALSGILIVVKGFETAFLGLLIIGNGVTRCWAALDVGESIKIT